jgi:hypothetical protein
VREKKRGRARRKKERERERERERELLCCKNASEKEWEKVKRGFFIRMGMR